MNNIWAQDFANTVCWYATIVMAVMAFFIVAMLWALRHVSPLTHEPPCRVSTINHACQ